MNAAVESVVYEYASEKISDVLEEIRPLLRTHYTEVAHYADIPLNPDFKAYMRAEQAGALRIYTARKFGALIGYAIYFLSQGLHYRGSLRADQDILYVSPEHRRGSVGARLILFTHRLLRAEGVQVVFQHSKIAHDIGPLLRRIGYEAVDMLWCMRLDRG